MGRQTGTLARRRRSRRTWLLALLLAVNVLAWVLSADWAARLAVLVVSLLVAPVLLLLVAARRA